MKKITLICMLLFLLTGCTSNNNATQVDDFDALPKVKNENEILLYDKYLGKIVSYDTANQKIAQKNTNRHYMQFGFEDLTSNLYSAGDFDSPDFKIFELVDNKLSVLYEAEKGEILIPLAYKDSKTAYFTKLTKSDPSKSDYDHRVICKFDYETKKLEELEATSGTTINNGVVIDDYLYYTIYRTTTDKYYWYEVYRIDTTKNQTPELVIDRLPDKYLYNNNGKLWVSDKENIYDYEDETNKFPKQEHNYFYGNTLYQVNPMNNIESSLTITDLTTKESTMPFHKVIDFKVDGDTVTIYQETEIVTHNLNKQ